MSPMPAMSLVMMAPMAAAMMVAMMLPSIAPALWRYHRHQRATRLPSAAQRTALAAAGYAIVWAMIGLALYAASAVLSAVAMALPIVARIAPWPAAAVFLCVGAVQRSQWKATRLRRCRGADSTARVRPIRVTTAWRDGLRLGVDCASSCAAPMALLLVAGLMDARTMLVITAAITAERVAPAGVRIARLTGALALAAGLVVCIRAAAPLAFR